MNTESHRFKVNLGGMIDLLSNHLYSSPKVYIRELLQNATDAIRAKINQNPNHQGNIFVEVIETKDEFTIMAEDNGVGLTEEEIHRFLAIIGESSKRNELGEAKQDFIGRFGIGLLSCFMVSNEITLITHSEKSPHTMKWIGKPDGTYTIEKVPTPLQHSGTKIYLRSKKEREEYFQYETVKELISYYGGLLPFPIIASNGKQKEQLNDVPVWLQEKNLLPRIEVLEYGKKIFGTEFLDYIPLHSAVGSVNGIAYILPHKVNIAVKSKHRVYLKRMLLSEESENVLPEWAFFVKCIINANDLRPTASREDFYEDEKLQTVQEELGNCLRNYLVTLAKTDTLRFRKIVAIHYLSIKTLALQDDELYKLFIKYLPFETSFGEYTIEEIFQHKKNILYTPILDEYRQIARVASAQSMLVINGGYIYDAELLEKLPEFFSDVTVERVNPQQITQAFEELTEEEQEQMFSFITLADKTLQKYLCRLEVKRFQPKEIAALYSTNEETTFFRSIEQTKEQTNEFFTSILDSVTPSSIQSSYAQLCCNYNNPLIQKLGTTTDTKFQKLAVEILYVQALLLGHYPLKNNELTILSTGLLQLLEWKTKEN